MPVRVVLLSCCFLLAVSCVTEKAKDAGDDILFEYRAKKYTRDDLPDNLRQKLYDAETRLYKDIENIANEFVTQDYTNEKGQKDNKDAKALEAESKNTAEPTEKELREFYEQRKDRIPYPYESVKNEIRTVIIQERGFKKSSALLDAARAAGGYKLLKQPPEAPALTVDTAGHPEKGNLSAKVTVVEFADFRCPHCGEAFRGLRTLYPKYKDKVKFIYMDYPLQADGPSKTIAQGGYCAHKQSKFWDYHDEAFANQAALTVESPATIAAKLKLDVAAFKTCVKSKEAADYVTKSRAEGQRVGVSATPTFYVNGKKVGADTSLKSLEASINAAL